MQDMDIKFTAIIIEIYSSEEIYPNIKAVKQILSFLQETWEI